MTLFASLLISAMFVQASTVSGDTLKNKPVPPSLIMLIEEATKQAAHPNDVEIEIDGLLVDDTKTKTGKDFYDIFYRGWEAPTEARNYVITVTEKPFRLSTTIISVSINDSQVYQAILQLRLDIIEAMTEEAIVISQDFLANYEEIMKQLNGEDLSGTGIY